MKKEKENKKKTREANESSKARKQLKKTVKSFICEQTNTEKKSTRVKLKKD